MGVASLDAGEHGPCHPWNGRASRMHTSKCSDFSVVVKNRGRLPAPWRWEIYRSGRNSAVKRSEAFFSTMTEADRAGKKALRLFLSEYQD